MLRRILRFLLGVLVTVISLAAIAAGLWTYFLYAPLPEPPPLSGTLQKGSIIAGGLTRTYAFYAPQGLAKGAPLVVVMHGAGQSGEEIRFETGYAFERLADQQGFALVYPDGFEGWWNSCITVDDSAANRNNIDDIAFLAALEDKLVAEAGINPDKIFATGLSNGGDMAVRLALEDPSRYRGVAPVAANLPAPENSKCATDSQGSTSVLLIHGTKDGLVPYQGGEGSLFGFYRSGPILSSLETGRYFAKRAGIEAEPAVTDGTAIKRFLWGAGSAHEVELFAYVGAGHVFPQPYFRAPRLLGASPSEPDAATVIWSFFVRQTSH